jgi:glycosyltransferase involved in cell wall biosynthesis
MKISIITINYNNLEGLKRTVESVVNQTWQEFDYIVIDGGSNDGSANYIESKSANIDYLISEPDTGIYSAMNKGISAAKGKYLLFLNSGDTLYNNKILNEISKSLTDNLDIYYGDLFFLNQGTLDYQKYPDQLSFNFFYKTSLPHPAAFIKKELFNELGDYNESLRIVSDWEFFILAICKFNKTYKHVNMVVSVFDTNGISCNEKNINIIDMERLLVLEKLFPNFIKDYEQLTIFSELLNMNRFKMLKELESNKLAQKLNSLFLRVLLFVFTGKTIKNL